MITDDLIDEAIEMLEAMTKNWRADNWQPDKEDRAWAVSVLRRMKQLKKKKGK